MLGGVAKAKMINVLFEIDLPALKAFLEQPLHLRSGRLKTLVAKVAVCPEIVAALLAGEPGLVGGVVGPDDLRAALLALEADAGEGHEIAPGNASAGIARGGAEAVTPRLRRDKIGMMKTKSKPAKPDEIELHPDAWERFEKAVDAVMQSPPKPQRAKDRAPSSARGGRPDAEEPG